MEKAKQSTRKDKHENSPESMMYRVFAVAELIVQSDHYQKIKIDNQKKQAKTQNP